MKVRELFDLCAKAYDRDRPKLVPSFDEYYGTGLNVIDYPREATIKFLDLGAGTGLFSAMLAKLYPHASIHLTDISVQMLDIARDRFSNNPNVSFSVQNHMDLGDLNKYDLVISALSIHHLSHLDKQKLFRKIHNALIPGGMFINTDQALGPTPATEAMYDKQWLKDVRTNRISESSLEMALERIKQDNNATLADQLQWLKNAGFTDVDCYYKRFRFIVYGGHKATHSS